MAERHPDDATIVAWTSGALTDVDAGAFEAHILVCTHCALRLEQCARVEEAMHEAAAHMREVPRTRRRASGLGSGLGSGRASMPAGLALAASLVLGLGLPGRWLSFDAQGELLASTTPMIEASSWGEPPSCAVPDDPSHALCDDPTAGLDFDGGLDGALAMTMPEPAGDDVDNLCVDEAQDGLVCGAGELASG